MTTYQDIGDKIKGYKILCEARQINNPRVISKTGRHKAQRTVLKDNALMLNLRLFLLVLYDLVLSGVYGLVLFLRQFL